MSKELAKTYDPKGLEDRLYQKWLDKGYFHATVNPNKKPFTHRASAAAAAVTRCQFLLVALRIVLSPFCLGGIGISDRKGTKRGPAQTKKGLSAARKAQQKDPLNDSGFLVRPIPRDPELGAPVPTAGRFPD